MLIPIIIAAGTVDDVLKGSNLDHHSAGHYARQTVEVMTDANPYAPVSYNAGLICASYIVSFVGALTALELLRRVTSPRGWMNWALLLASSFAMGGVGIWSMHYIANRAIILYNGAPGFELGYSAAFAILSFFIPIVMLLVAYFIIGGSEDPPLWRVIVSGAVPGLAICGMHYISQLSITNYVLSYNVGHVIGSILIGIFASILGLTLFFRLRRKWNDSIWKRIVCAIILAGAVSGLHWVAATGTYYTWIPGTRLSKPQRWTGLIIIIICVAACGFLTFVVFRARRLAREQRKRSQKVVLACATFDPDGKVMMTTEGMLPCQEITDSFHERSFDESFDTTHPVFQWIFRVSCSWKSIRDLIPRMRSHLTSAGTESQIDYSVLFREKFCITAQSLADSMSVPLEELGVAYDQILETGVLSPKMRMPRFFKGSQTPSTPRGTTRGPSGQFLFLVKHVSRTEATQLLSSGFRFAEQEHVIGTIARAMKIERIEAEKQLLRMSLYTGSQRVFAPGIHLAFFGMRPNVSKGFNVVVRENASHTIPSMQLLETELDASQHEFIQKYMGKTVDEILRELRTPENETQRDYDIKSFRCQFHGALITLSQEIKEPAFMDALMLPQTFEIAAARPKSSSSAEELKRKTATLIILRSIVPIHNTSTDLQSSRLTYSPLQLFLTQKSVLSTTSRQSFANDIQTEFLPLFQSSEAWPRQPTREHKPSWFPMLHLTTRQRLKDPAPWDSSDVMERGMTESVQEVTLQPGEMTPSNSEIRSTSESDGSTVIGHKPIPVDLQKDNEIRTSTASVASSTDLLPAFNDELVWTDICFKGLATRLQTQEMGRWRKGRIGFNEEGFCTTRQSWIA